jgi:hypothetical protein
MAEHRRPETRGEESGLRDCRRRIEALAGEGRFRVACARTGESPVPVAGLRFPDRETAATAAWLTRRYRAALRRWDPETPWLDPVVHERGPRGPDPVAAGGEPVDSDVAATGGEP